jgi:hypothetical protein
MRFAYLCVLVCAVERWSVESTDVGSEPGQHKYPQWAVTDTMCRRTRAFSVPDRGRTVEKRS